VAPAATIALNAPRRRIMPSSALELEDRPNDGPLHPGLYVVATPIGNLEDLSARAIRVLQTAEIVACEDTRVSRTLLQRISAAGRCVALHAHNEARQSPILLAAVADGARIALISDAGTPAVSDPGARFVAAALARGLTVVPVPGPSAVTAAVSVAALVDGRFRFEGFLPPRPGQRCARLEQLATSDVAVVLFEAPHRIEALAAAIAATIEPTRIVVVGRELTKRFEQIARLEVAQLCAWLGADPDHRRGEFVLVIHPAEPPLHSEVLSELGRRAIAVLAESMPPRAAARAAARISGDDADALYRFKAGQRSKDAGP
jgi:16S rRNA (cytidine1402-2'-O)-methyltransferase